MLDRMSGKKKPNKRKAGDLGCVLAYPLVVHLKLSPIAQTQTHWPGHQDPLLCCQGCSCKRVVVLQAKECNIPDQAGKGSESRPDAQLPPQPQRRPGESIAHTHARTRTPDTQSLTCILVGLLYACHWFCTLHCFPLLALLLALLFVNQNLDELQARQVFDDFAASPRLNALNQEITSYIAAQLEDTDRRDGLFQQVSQHQLCTWGGGLGCE